MRQKSVVPGLLVVGAVTLMLLVSVACEPPFPTAEIQARPTDTPIRLTDTPVPTLTPLPATPTLPTPEEKEEKEIAVPTIPAQSIVTVEPEAEKVLAVAKADLMQRLGVSEEDILVKSVEGVQWPDSSLGCPQPGMMYLQVITPGFRVVLTVNGKDYEYHTDYQRAVPCSSLLPSNDRRQQ